MPPIGQEGYQHIHNRDKKLIESGRFHLHPGYSQQKLSTLFSTAVDNFFTNYYSMLRNIYGETRINSGGEDYQRRRHFSRQITAAEGIDS
jgi:hypothetical protein